MPDVVVETWGVVAVALPEAVVTLEMFGIPGIRGVSGLGAAWAAPGRARAMTRWTRPVVDAPAGAAQRAPVATTTAVATVSPKTDRVVGLRKAVPRRAVSSSVVALMGGSPRLWPRDSYRGRHITGEGRLHLISIDCRRAREVPPGIPSCF